MKKAMILTSVILVTFLLWGAVGLYCSLQFGAAGIGGSILIGFAAVPVIIRMTVSRLYQRQQQ